MIDYFCFRDSIILSRRYLLSGSTFLSLGISIGDDLSSTIKTFIHNKHDFFISLSHNALTKLYEDATRKKVKEYFYNRSDDNSIIKLDQNISLYFVKFSIRVVLPSRIIPETFK